MAPVITQFAVTPEKEKETLDPQNHWLNLIMFATFKLIKTNFILGMCTVLDGYTYTCPYYRSQGMQSGMTDQF